MSKTRPWKSLGIALLTTAILQMGACIEAAPFSGGDATDDAGATDVSIDGSSDDSEVVDVPNDEGSGPPQDTQPDGEEPDGDKSDGEEPDATQSDTDGPCDQAGCDCSTDAPCADGLTCYDGACCKPLCSDTIVCGSDGCGGDCGPCGEGELCSDAQECVFSCTPGPVCGLGEDADLALVCNQDGTGYDDSIPATNCKNTAKSCLNGECQCIPSCDSEQCGDDGANDGCNGVCPETCADNEICGTDGVCAQEECPTGEVFCHNDGAPYLCVDGTMAGSVAAGPVVDCGEAECLIQDFGDLGELESLDDFDKYCACSGPQHCLDAEHLHYCGDLGLAAILPCDGGKVCDDASNACANTEDPGDATCCAGKWGFVAGCGGTCECANGEEAGGDGKCYESCSLTLELGHSFCSPISDKVIYICELGTPAGLDGQQYWTPYWCVEETDDVESFCETSGDDSAECTEPSDGPSEASDPCCEAHAGQCGFIDACDGTCSCQNSDIYPPGYTCSQGACTAPCTAAQAGLQQCINDSAIAQCTVDEEWLISLCAEDEQCDDSDGASNAQCAGSPPDLIALPLNVDETMPGMPAASQYGQVSDHDDFSVAGSSGDDPFSLSMWIWGAALNLEDVQPLMRKGGFASETTNASAGSSEWILFVKDKRFYWIVYDMNGVAWYKRSNTVTGPINSNWAHLVVAYPGNNMNSGTPHQFTKFYLNGEDVTDNSGAGAGSSSATASTYSGSLNGPKPLQIGFSPQPQPFWFTGAIDDVAILQTYLTANVISAMTVGNTQCGKDLTQTSMADHLVAYWRFEDLGDGATQSHSLVDDHEMNLMGYTDMGLNPWDSPCNSVP